MRKLLLLGSAVLLSGCVVSMSSRMQSFVGRRDTDVVSKIGAPDKSVVLSDSSRVLTWSTQYCDQSLTVSKSGVVEKWSVSRGCPSVVRK